MATAPAVRRGPGRTIGLGAAHRAASCAVLAAAAAGCQSDLRRSVREIDAAYAQGRYPGAAEIAERAAERNADDRADQLLWWLQAGRTRQAAGDVAASIAWYDRAYEAVRPYLDSKAEATVSEALVTTAVNQTMRIYRATPPERIMLCALQGANRLASGDLAGARVEFNRAADFQQDAVSRFAQEINAAQERTNAEWKSGGWATGISTDATAKVRQAQERPASALGMSSFGNPFASYLRAAFLLATSTDPGDRQTARADLRGVQEMLPGCAEAAADIAAIDAGGGPPPVTWIFFLTGVAPTYREFRLDIPIPVGNVNYVSAAFPVLERRGGFIPAIDAGGARSSTIADLDAAVEAEFDARLPLISCVTISGSRASRRRSCRRPARPPPPGPPARPRTSRTAPPGCSCRSSASPTRRHPPPPTCAPGPPCPSRWRCCGCRPRRTARWRCARAAEKGSPAGRCARWRWRPGRRTSCS